MSSPAVNIPPPTAVQKLDEVVGRLREKSKEFVHLAIGERIAMVKSMLEGTVKAAERSVHSSCIYKGIALGTPTEGEEWLAGPFSTIRNLRLLVEQLETIARTGNTRIGKVDHTVDGRLRVHCFPWDKLDGLLQAGLTGELHLEQGVTEKELEETRASFYKKPKHDGRVCLVLGAGNVASIPPKDVALKMFTEGKVCILKMNPVNAYIGPFIEEAFAEPIKRGYLAVVYGGGEEGAYLTRHPGVDEIHITGSDKTHDMIVWGPPGPERAERMARNKPLIDKEITSELGNVSAVSILPGPYTPKQIAFQGEMIAGAITNNASFNCNAAKMLILPKGWDKREAFLAAVQKGLAAAPPRRAYYPGAFDRYKFLTEGRANVVKIGTPGQDGLPWTMVLGVDAASESERAFVTEPFCAIVSETELASAEPAAFLDAAVDFVNNKLWGTLNTTLVVHPELQKDPKMNEAIERAITKLRFGTVAINTWPAAAFALGTTAWGGHPSSTLTNIQSGRGFVGNSMMIERIEKCVLRHPLTSSPKPPTFPSHKTAHLVGRRISYLSEKQSWSKLPGLIAAALRG